MNKKNNLRVYAGALAAATFLNVGSFVIRNRAPKPVINPYYIEILNSIDLNENDITAPMEKYILEDGSIIYTLPADYMEYHINKEYEEVMQLSICYFEEHTEYEALSKQTFDGYIGVKTEYWYKLHALNSLRNSVKIKEDKGEPIVEVEYIAIKNGEELENLVKEEYYSNYGKTNSRS